MFKIKEKVLQISIEFKIEDLKKFLEKLEYYDDYDSCLTTYILDNNKIIKIETMAETTVCWDKTQNKTKGTIEKTILLKGELK